jgi:hypothetical protein
MHLSDDKANHYLLPIAPMLLLEGIFFFDLTKNAPQRPVKGLRLTEEQVEYAFDAICASSVTEIVCSRKLPQIPEALVRAKKRGIRFHTITDPRSIRSAGLKRGAGNLRFRVVPTPEYVSFIHSFVRPPTEPR